MTIIGASKNCIPNFQGGSSSSLTITTILYSISQLFWRGKARWIFLFVTSFCIFFMMTATFLFALYPITAEDLLINQGIFRVRNQPLSTETFSNRGLQEMVKSKVTILGVARNIGHQLPQILPQIETLSKFFATSQVIFVEGDSEDDTVMLLDQWASRSPENRTILHTTAKGEKDTGNVFKDQLLPREGRIALARNEGLNYMHIVGFNLPGIMDSFGRPSWDVMCAHGILLHGLYRDAYAFRLPGISTNHHYHGDDHALYNITIEQRMANKQAFKTNKVRVQSILDMTGYSRDQMSLIKPIEVESCFGGLAIYREEVMADCSYQYRYPEPPNMLDCEHVLFHRCMKEQHQARIFTNPHMKLWYGHSDISVVTDRVKKMLRGSVLPFTS
eukprot:gene10583-11727_t